MIAATSRLEDEGKLPLRIVPTEAGAGALAILICPSGTADWVGMMALEIWIKRKTAYRTWSPFSA